MATHIAFLRAINVGGRGVITMTDLRAAFEDAGCRDVRTFQAAGNVAFTVPRGVTAALKTRIATAIRARLGAEPGICYRTHDELEALVAANPFGDLTGDRTLKLYVSFMDRVPRPLPALPIVDPREHIEIIRVRGADALIVSRRKPNGLMYGFPNFAVERLGVVATSRNWSTVTKIVDFAQQQKKAG